MQSGSHVEKLRNREIEMFFENFLMTTNEAQTNIFKKAATAERNVPTGIGKDN